MLITLTLAALASPTFPVIVANEVDMPCTPSCVLCHATAAGGSGTASQDFAFAMLAAGLVQADDATVPPALAAVAETESDVDGDGLTDIEALGLGRNPNIDGVDFCSVPLAQYGCFPSESGGLLVGGMVLGVWRRMRRVVRRDPPG